MAVRKQRATTSKTYAMHTDYKVALTQAKKIHRESGLFYIGMVLESYSSYTESDLMIAPETDVTERWDFKNSRWNKTLIVGEDFSILKKYSFKDSTQLLKVEEDIKGSFCIRPISWSGRYKGYKLIQGEVLAKFNTKKNAKDALVNICGYSKGLVEQLS